MNVDRLKAAEWRFLARYPGGFTHPAMVELAKKHKVEKMKKLAADSFGPAAFADPGKIAAAMVKTVSQSTLVSVFEKPQFRDAVQSMTDGEKAHLSHGLAEFLHGEQSGGFALLAGLLQEYKIAKWPLLTVIPIYYRPAAEMFVKPTTAKKIIQFFELSGLTYSPAPTFEFYRAYREQILLMKQNVDSSLQVDNAAFCGFLMLALETE